MREFLSFGWACLKTAFAHSKGIIDFSSSVLGILASFSLWLLKRSGVVGMEDAMTDLYWQIPVGFCAIFGGARLLISPYWVYKEERDKRGKAEADLKAMTDELNATPNLAGTWVREDKGRFTVEQAGNKITAKFRQGTVYHEAESVFNPKTRQFEGLTTRVDSAAPAGMQTTVMHEVALIINADTYAYACLGTDGLGTLSQTHTESGVLRRCKT